MNSSLESFGIRTGQDIQHRSLADPKVFEANKFFDQAISLLEKVSPVVLESIVPKLENPPEPPRWNPGGFIVFPLGLTKDNSSLRLHVSPQGLSRGVLNGPFIHNHGWQLASKVIGGRYSDTIYSLETVEPNDTQPNEVTIYRLYETLRGESGKDKLVFNGSLVKTTPVQERVIIAGQFHTIEAITVYHKPTTPPEIFSATLVLDSPAFSSSTHVLFETSYQPSERVRKIPSHEEILIAKDQLLGITTI